MYDGSCTDCKQIYNYPPEWEESCFEQEKEEISEIVEEEEIPEIVGEEEISEESVTLDKPKQRKGSLVPFYESSEYEISELSEEVVYDYKNCLPDLEDMYIGKDDGSNFHFDEQLFMVNRNTKKRCGSMKIVVEHLENVGFFVLLHYSFSKGSKMYEVYNYGYVRSNYDSTNEVRYEIEIDVVRPRQTVHSLYVRPIGKQYELSERHAYGNDHCINNKTSVSFDEFVSVLSESANIILMRQVAQKDFVGFKFVKSVLTNREICPAQLKCYPYSWYTVNKKKTELKRIRKRIYLPTHALEESNAYLTRNGQIALLQWCGASHYAVINHRAEIVPGYRPKDPKLLIPARQRYLKQPNVKQQIEMDTNRQIMKSRNYLADHPEATAIISYICKQILLTKPHKVILFVKRCILPYL